MRRDLLVNDEFYHIYNRGADKREVFLTRHDYSRFLSSIVEFNTELPGWQIRNLKNSGIKVRPRLEEQLVDVVAYCLNPNHFHLLLRQRKDAGITEFMRKVITGYTMYFNKKNERSGVLFQGKFKSVHIDSNEQLLYVSAYVNCNSEVHGIGKAKNYLWCSFNEYCGRESGINCQKEVILEQLHDSHDYGPYALNHAVEIKVKKEMGKLVIE